MIVVLFALTNDGKKLYHVPYEWNQLSQRIYSQYNSNPKFLTHSYQLQETENGEFIIIKNNEGFIDFQTMVNEEIINKKWKKF